MNVLPKDKQIQIITALTEGCSIRSVERMTGAHRDTIMRLLVRTGYRCMSIMDDTIKNVRTSVIECDEVWTFVGKKDYSYPLEQQTPGDGGSQFVAVAMDRDTKLIITYRVGKRIPELAYGVISDLKERVIGKPTIVCDGWYAYYDSVAEVYGRYGCHFGQLVKSVSQHRRKFVREGYHVAKVVSARKYPIFGDPRPSDISTSIVERQNWTLRTHMRRMTRMSNGFSRKLENLKAAVALHYCAYNFCRIHRALRVTPAMAAGVSDHVWEIDELLSKMKTWKFNSFIRTLEQNGFELDRTTGNSRVYKGTVGGMTRLVSVHFHRGGEDIKSGTLDSMIRQSGLAKKLFR